MDKIIETYDYTLRTKLKQQDLSEKETLNIIRALDDLGLTYIDIGTPAMDHSTDGIYAAICELELKNSQLVPFVRAVDCGDKVGHDSLIEKLLELDTQTVCVEGESSEFLVRERHKMRPEESMWRIESIISWLKSRGKTVIFNAANFFDAFDSAGNAYAREVIKGAIRSGADRIVLCDTNGFCLPHDIVTTMGIVSSMFKRFGINCANSSACANAHAVSAVRTGAIHVQGTFLGIYENCGSINLSTTIVNLQLGMGYRCIQDIKINRITPTAEYISEQQNTFFSASTPYVGKDSFNREINPIPHTRSHAITADMIGNSIKVNVAAVNSSVNLIERLRTLGYNVTREQIDALGTLYTNEEKGYITEVSLLMKVLRAMNEIPNMYQIISIHSMEEFIGDGEYVKTIAVVEVSIAGKKVLETATGNGALLAIWNCFIKALSHAYPCVAKMRISSLRTRVFVDSGRYKVVLDVTNSEQSWGVSASGENAVACAVGAILDVIDYQLLINGYYR